jgi:hypothetical protein
MKIHIDVFFQGKKGKKGKKGSKKGKLSKKDKEAKKARKAMEAKAAEEKEFKEKDGQRAQSSAIIESYNRWVVAKTTRLQTLQEVHIISKI